MYRLTGFWFILVIFGSTAVTSELSYVLTGARLPEADGSFRAVYDGQDSIIIFGSNKHNEILKYSLSENELQIVANATVPAYSGSVVQVGPETTFCLGGRHYDNWGTVNNGIYRYSSNQLDSGELVANMTVLRDFHSSAWDGHDSIYSFGGDNYGQSPSTVSKYSISTNSVEEIEVNKPDNLIGNSCVSVWDEETRNVYVLGGFGYTTPGQYGQRIAKYDPLTKAMELAEVELPTTFYYPCAFRRANGIFVYGGIETFSTLAKFVPALNTVEGFFVQNAPYDSLNNCCVYVEKEDRVYVIGGVSLSEGGGAMDTIAYIDLAELPF